MKHLDFGLLIRIFSGLFLIALGLTELNAQQAFLHGVFRGITQPFGADAGALNTIAALVELAAGLLLVAGLFLHIRGSVYRVVMIAVFIAWIGRIIYHSLFAGFMEPDFLLWLKGFSFDAVFAVVLWLLYSGKTA
jgi:uncharacterized membrane protein YphA (DoxX/SURF4 family)